MSVRFPMPRAVLRAATVAVLAMTMAAGPASAGRTTTGATVRVADGVFAGTTTAWAGPAAATWVRARCYQDGKLVFEQWRPFDTTTRTASLTLGPTPSWTGGSANCTAEDGYWRRATTWRPTSSTTFAVRG